MEKLYQLDPTGRFFGRADDYARYRPDYPEEAIDAILARMPETSIIVDVGAGTGISSRRLAARGARVIAVEPNAAMRSAAEPHPRVEWIEAPAESIPLPDHSADIVTAFQAFHWFQPVPALSEFARILKPGGRLTVVWNERDPSDPFTSEYGKIIREHSRNHPAEHREQTIDALLASDLFGDVEHLTFRYEQRLSLQGLLGRARSASYLPAEGEAWERLIGALTRLHQQWRDARGKVTLLYRTEVYLAHPDA